MFKHIYLIVNITFLFACNPNSEPNHTIKTHSDLPSTDLVDTAFVVVDTSSLMVASFIASLGPDAATKLHSWTINADALRKYLDDTSIKEMNISLAHTMRYINQGNYGVPAGFTPGALSIILTGIDHSRHVVYYQNTYALNRAKPCPPTCASVIISN